MSEVLLGGFVLVVFDAFALIGRLVTKPRTVIRIIRSTFEILMIVLVRWPGDQRATLSFLDKN